MPSLFLGYVSMIKSMIKVVSDPRERFGPRRRRMAAAGERGRCGCCPACHEFVFLASDRHDGPAPCPRCGKPIGSLDPLGPG